MNTKKTIIFIFLGLMLIFLTVLMLQNLDAKNTPKTDYHSFTKAICDSSNFCQDNLIECQGKEIKTISPITGAFIQFDKEWNDPRTQKEIEKEC
jgi:hypothetical protein